MASRLSSSPWALLAAALAALALAACSGGDGNPQLETTPPGDAGAQPEAAPPGDGWEGRTNIEAIFEASCSQCHGTQWSTCWDVQSCASSVQSMVSSGAMPRGGSLSPSDESALLGWLGQGAPCSGSKPAGTGGCGFVGGAGAPVASGAEPASR